VSADKIVWNNYYSRTSLLLGGVDGGDGGDTVEGGDGGGDGK